MLRLHFHQLQTVTGVAPIPDNGGADDVGQNFLNQFQSLRALLRRDKREAGDITAGPRQADDKARSDGIADLCHNNGNGVGRVAGGLCRLGPRCHDDIYVCPDQFGRERRQAIGLSLGIAKFKEDISTFDPAQIREPLFQFSNATLIFRIAGREPHEHTDPPHPIRLLRPYREGPRNRHTAEKRD